MKNKYKIFSQRSFRALLVAVLISSLTVFSVFAQELTQGYSSDDNLVRGSIVALNKEDSTKVETISSDQLERMFGVVVRSNDSALSLSEDNQGVFVATKGRFEILVTDINGEIKNGDLISLSSFPGIGMKADGRQKFVIATALQDFDVNNPDSVISKTEVKDTAGQSHNASIGRIIADVEVKPNPLALENQNVPAFLASISSTIAQKPVTAARIYAGLIVLLLTSTVSASLLYSVIRSAVISIGRNPLARKYVLKGVIQVIMISILIFVAGLFAVYLILKL
jgi:hypothetical protein